MDIYERYFFDLNGYLVVEDVLTSQELDALNEAIDRNADRIVQKEPLSEGSAALKGKAVRGELEGMLTWPKPWCQPFRDLMDHPKIVPYLTELIGERFLLDHLYGIVMSEGAEGLHLHGGGVGDSDFETTQFFYRFHHGRIRNGLTVVTYVLTDHGMEDGGFMVIPGSHKSNIPLPGAVASMEKDMGVTKQIAAKAGSAIMFTEALSHGTLPWRASHERRAVLYKYTPGTMYLAQSYLGQGVEELLAEFTPEQQALMNPIPTRSW